MFGGTVEQLQSRLGRESPVQKAFNAFNEAIRDVRLALAELFEKVFKSGAFTKAMYWLSGSGGRTTGFPYLADNIDRFVGMIGDPSQRTGAFGDFLNALDSMVETFKTYNPFTGEGRANLVQAWRELMANMLIAFNDTFIGGMLTSNETVQNAVQASLSDTERATVESVYRGQANPDQITNRRMYEALIKMIDDRTTQLDNQTGFGYEWSGMIPEDVEANRLIDEEVAKLRRILEGLPDPGDLPYLGPKSLGTLGTLGTTREPRTGLAKIHAGERVLSPAENAALESLVSTQGVPQGNMSNSLVQKLLDETKENRVQLINALNTLHLDMRELQRKQDATVSAIENYA